MSKHRLHCGIIAVFLCGNLVLPSLFWGASLESEMGALGHVTTGVLLSELFLLSLWLQRAALSLLVKVMQGTMLTLAAGLSFCLGVSLVRVADLMLFILFTTVATTLFGSAVTCILRPFIGQLTYKTDDVSSIRPFSLAFVFALISACALILCLLRYLVEDYKRAIWDSVVLFGHSELSAIASASMVLMKQHRWFASMVALLGIVAGPALVLKALELSGGNTGPRDLRILYLYTLGLMTSTSIVAWLWRRAGYQLA